MPRLRGGRRGICARPAAGGGAAPLCPRWPRPSSGGRAVSGGASLVAGLPLARCAPPGAGGSPRVCGRGPRRSVAVAAFPVRRSSAVVLRRSGLRSPAPVVRPPLRLRGAGGGGFAAALCARPPVAWGGRSWGGALRVVGFAHPPPVPRPPGRGRRRVTFRCGGVSGPSGQISDVKSEITVDKGPKLCYSVIAGLHANAPSLLRKRPGHIVPGPLSLRHRTPLAAILCA